MKIRKQEKQDDKESVVKPKPDRPNYEVRIVVEAVDDFEKASANLLNDEPRWTMREVGPVVQNDTLFIFGTFVRQVGL